MLLPVLLRGSMLLVVTLILVLLLMMMGRSWGGLVLMLPLTGVIINTTATRGGVACTTTAAAARAVGVRRVGAGLLRAVVGATTCGLLLIAKAVGAACRGSVVVGGRSGRMGRIPIGGVPLCLMAGNGNIGLTPLGLFSDTMPHDDKRSHRVFIHVRVVLDDTSAVHYLHRSNISELADQDLLEVCDVDVFAEGQVDAFPSWGTEADEHCI